MAAQEAVGAAPTEAEAGKPLMKTYGEGKPCMAALMLLLLFAARQIPVELVYKMAAALDDLQNTGGADDGYGDEKKLRADSPAMVDCLCILKSCERGWEEKTGDRFMGVKGLGTTNHKRMSVGVRSWKGSLGQDC